jgi:hypothetical protein
MKSFIFLYPIPEIINFEIENNGWHERGGTEEFRKKYRNILNNCIDLRYRQDGFSINYAIFDGHKISDVIKIQPSDRIIEVGLDFKTHNTKQPDGKYPYPDQDHILDKLGDIKTIRVAGFHMWDCVEKLAKKAHERGLNALVDEDLTEFFCARLRDENFQVDKYPTFDPRKALGDRGFKSFMHARENKPWLWQKY